jgi:hypothetical protein
MNNIDYDLSSDELRRGGNHPTYSSPPLKRIVGRIVLAMARLIRHRIWYLVSIMICRRMNPAEAGTIRPTVSFYQDESL